MADVAAASATACPCCATALSHPEDVKHGYCPVCKWWTSDPVLGPGHMNHACPHRVITPGGARVRRPDGTAVECDLVRDPARDADGYTAWIAVPREPLTPEPGTLVVEAYGLQPSTRIAFRFRQSRSPL
jgi:hypothetical protein